MKCYSGFSGNIFSIWQYFLRNRFYYFHPLFILSRSWGVCHKPMQYFSINSSLSLIPLAFSNCHCLVCQYTASLWLNVLVASPWMLSALRPQTKSPGYLGATRTMLHRLDIWYFFLNSWFTALEVSWEMLMRNLKRSEPTRRFS